MSKKIWSISIIAITLCLSSPSAENVRLHSKHKIEHNKFTVFDSKLAINGSYNWTEPASEVNSENCAVMPEPNAIAAYAKRFKELWEMNSETKSRAALAEIEAKRGSRSLSSKTDRW